jgi:deoxyribodipyrimidine photo-lyase
MSRDQRVDDNHALTLAQAHALKEKCALVVGFVLYPSVRYRTSRHYAFMSQGLVEVGRRLEQLHIPFIVVKAKAIDGMKRLLDLLSPRAVYVDMSPLKGPRLMQQAMAHESPLPWYRVDAHNIIPVWHASDHEEIGAYTLRPKIHRMLNEFLVPAPPIKPHPYRIKISYPSYEEMFDQSYLSFPLSFPSGERHAHAVLTDFLHHRLGHYLLLRNDPTVDMQSQLSPYLHFGQISSLRVALATRAYTVSHPHLKESADSFLEEIIVRKELADNFCWYNPHYDSIEGAKAWAQDTLNLHVKDVRPHHYSYDTLVEGKTSDPAWNAAQKQLIATGKMHGYMRMYWAKQLLLWTKDAHEAIEYAIKLNDMYHLDGYDPNGYTGIMWSIAGVHDRPWFERPIFGKIRYMNANGLKRKYDIASYIAQWNV